SPLGDQRIGPLLYRLRHQELELARFIPPRRQAGAIISLDIKIGTIQEPGQIGHELNRRGKMAQTDAGKSGKIHDVASTTNGYVSSYLSHCALLNTIFLEPYANFA